ncbi:MAG: tetratricopeptide repeat protein [Proteobacteria bacterium]|nr:tetratricopeptide repeat protein [Pseudomonadota bacterium]
MKPYFLYLIIIIFLSALTCSAQATSEESIPIAASLILFKAGQLVSEEKTESAIDLLEKFKAKAEEIDAKTAAKKGYTHYSIDFTLGNYYLMLSQTQKAILCYQTVLEKKADLSDAWLNLAKCHYDLNQMRGAGNAFLKGYETSAQKSAVYLYYSSVSYMMAEDYKEAYSISQLLLKAHSQEIELSWKESLVQIMFGLEKYSEALPFIEELAEKNTGKKRKAWQEVLLSQYIMLQMDEKAFSYAGWLTQEDTLEPKWWKALCHLCLSKNQLENGLAALIIYGFLTPMSDDERSLMADLYMMAGIPAKAIMHYEAVLKEGSISMETYKKIAQGFLRMYDPEAALSWVEKGLAQEEDTELLMLKGNLLYETGHFQEAAQTYERLCRENKDCGHAFLMLGYALWNIGDINKAQKAFKKAHSFTKEKKSAHQALQQLAKLNNN